MPALRPPAANNPALTEEVIVETTMTSSCRVCAGVSAFKRGTRVWTYA